MSGFIASPPAPASPPGETVTADGWWPDIDVNLFRNVMRIGGQAITDDRVKEALAGGIIVAADNLHDWRAEQEAAGAADLESIPAPQIAATSRLVVCWRRAVFAFAAADLLETHGDVTATKDGLATSEIRCETAADHRRNGIHALRDIIGKPRTTVELI